LDEKQKERINEYLAHSGKVADRYNRQTTNANIALTGQMVQYMI
jgi:hypothetical protein